MPGTWTNNFRTAAQRVIAALTVLVVCSGLAIAEPAQLDENCVVTILNRNTQVSPNGNFGIANIPIPFGAFRARVVCEDKNGLRRAQSAFVTGVANGETDLGVISVATPGDAPPSSIVITSGYSG